MSTIDYGINLSTLLCKLDHFVKGHSFSQCSETIHSTKSLTSDFFFCSTEFEWIPRFCYFKSDSYFHECQIQLKNFHKFERFKNEFLMKSQQWIFFIDKNFSNLSPTLNPGIGSATKLFTAVINGRESAVNRALDGSIYPG